VGKWANALAAVAVMTIDNDPRSISALFCSGVNVSPNNRILTNQHCIPNQVTCDNTEFVFGLYRQTCSDTSPVAEWKSFRCGDLLISSDFAGCSVDAENLDFVLTSVLGDPAVTFGFAAPSAESATSNDDVYIFQHSDGLPLKIAQEDAGDSDFLADSDNLNLRYFGKLDTQGGSSGAPIFDASDNKLIGIHHCGDDCNSPPARGNRGVQMAAIYPVISPFLCTPGSNPDLSASGFTDLAEVTGNGDTVIDPGETWQFTPRLHNAACTATATKVTAEIQANTTSAAVHILNPNVSFGQLAASTTGAASAPVQFRLTTTVPCGQKVILDLVNVTATNSGPFPNAPQLLSVDIGSTEATSLLFEDFSSGIPVGWKVTHSGTGSLPDATWTTTNPGNRPRVGLTAPFAIADAGELTTGQLMDERLVTPFIDAHSFSRVELQFAHDFKKMGSGGVADVDVRSSATGGLWQNIARFSSDSTSGSKHLDLTSLAAGHSDVKVRFRYSSATSAADNWWAVDDISLVGHNGFVCNVFNPDNLIFADGFESGNTNAWSTEVDPHAQLTVVPGAALFGNFGMWLTLGATTDSTYVQDNSPTAEFSYRARFYFDLTNLQMQNGSQHQFFAAYQESPLTNVVNLVLRFENGQYSVRAKTRKSDQTWVPTSRIPITKARHFIEVRWRRASSETSTDGLLWLWIDNVLVARLESITNDQLQIDWVRVGAVQGLDAETSGTLAFDRFESRRRSLIGP
jgi:hypothetical protein